MPFIFCIRNAFSLNIIFFSRILIEKLLNYTVFSQLGISELFEGGKPGSKYRGEWGNRGHLSKNYYISGSLTLNSILLEKMDTQTCFLFYINASNF
jgi:hypothetical protein